MGIAQRYEQARAEVRATCEQAGRLPQGVTLVAVSKTVGLDGVHRHLVCNYPVVKSSRIIGKGTVCSKAHNLFSNLSA